MEKKLETGLYCELVSKELKDSYVEYVLLYYVKIFKKLGIWIEDDTITPELGYVIVYNWDKAVQPNDEYSDHIGFVENVSSGMITAIEGNRGEKVDRRVIPLGWGYIRSMRRL